MAEFNQESRQSFFGRLADYVPGEGGNYRLFAALEQTKSWRQNLRKRLLAGVPALVLVLVLVAFAPLVVVVLVVAAAGIYGMREYLQLVNQGLGQSLPSGAMLVGAGLIGLGPLFRSYQAMQAMLLLAMLIVLLFVWFSRERDTYREFQNAGAAFVGLLLVPWLLNHLGLLVQIPDGRGAVNFLVLVITLNDTAAYLVGSLIGKRPLLPSVSPHKTVEGALAGLVGGLAGGVISWSWLGGGVLGFGVVALCTLGVLLAAVAQAGDLLESKIKRLTHADESGSFLPGHGGLLDRVDSYLLAAPFFYYFVWAFYL